MTVDAAIIGGGPAGAAAAISLRQLTPGTSIAIFDVGASDRWRPGETLAPGAEPILESLGLSGIVREFPESYETRAAWGSENLVENVLPLNGRLLDRTRFEAILLEHAVAMGVDVHRNCALTESDREGGNWSLSVNGDDCASRFVIDASGRAARFAVDRDIKRLADDRLTGVVVRYEGARRGGTLVEAQECGWWYSAATAGGTTAAIFMTDSDMIRDLGPPDIACWEQLLADSRWMRERLSGATPQSPPVIFPAHSQVLSRLTGPGWVAVGDAAMAFDPIASQGIQKALRSGQLASFVAADYLTGGDSHNRYAEQARAEYEAYSKTKCDYYALEQRWPEAEFWKRRY